MLKNIDEPILILILFMVYCLSTFIIICYMTYILIEPFLYKNNKNIDYNFKISSREELINRFNRFNK